MILARAPLRISLGGGGTDLTFYSSQFGGFVLSAAINHYVYVAILRPPIEKGIRVKARINEYVEDVSKLQNELVRECCLASGITERLGVVFSSDLSDGTGMGTSGAYAVCLTHVLQHLKGEPLAPQQLSELAAQIEIERLGRPIGKHDHYMAAFGGVRTLKIATDGRVEVEDAGISKDTLRELKGHLMLFYTGKKRESREVLFAQKESVLGARKGMDAEYYHRIKNIGFAIHDALKGGQLQSFGKLMHEHWKVKRSLSGGVSNDAFDSIYEAAIHAGAVGGKLIGAGGGGLFLFYVPYEKRAELRSAMEAHALDEVEFDFEWRGSAIVFDGVSSNYRFSERPSSAIPANVV